MSIYLNPTTSRIITVQEAAYLLEKHSYPYNKDRRHGTPGGIAHVNRLATRMLEGSWRPRRQIIFGQVGDYYTILDGHHRLNAQLIANMDIEWSIDVQVCETMQDLTGCYATVDTEHQLRTSSQIIDQWHSEYGIPIGIAKRCMSATPYFETNFDFNKIKSGKSVCGPSNARRLEYLLENGWHTAAQLYVNEVAGNPIGTGERLLRGAGLFAVVMMTLRYTTGDMNTTAIQFWRKLAHQDGLFAGSPGHSLQYFIESYSVNKRGGRRRSPNNYDHQIRVAKAAAYTWNHHIMGAQFQRFRKGFENIPFRIEGVPGSFWEGSHRKIVRIRNLASGVVRETSLYSE